MQFILLDDIVQELLKFQRESISTVSKESEEKNISKKNSSKTS